MCSNNPIRTDNIKALFALFEPIYFHDTRESEEDVQALTKIFMYTTDNRGNPAMIDPPFVSNPVSNDLESLNILYSKIQANRNSISYILSVNSYNITSSYETIYSGSGMIGEDEIVLSYPVEVNPTPVVRRFVYNITSPSFTDCTNITYRATFNKNESRKLNTQVLASYASSNSFIPYSSSNTFSNIKILHEAYELQQLLTYYPTAHSIIEGLYSNNSLNQILNTNDFRYAKFSMPYYNLDNFTYNIIINNISSKKIYKYEDLEVEGRIYYTDSIPFNYIWNLYELSNIRTYINHSDVPFSNSPKIYHLRVELTDRARNDIFSRIRGRFFENITEANILSITDITSVNLTTYLTTNNFMSNSNYQIYTATSGDIDTISIFNSNSYTLDFVKSNCQINFINPNRNK